MKPTIEQMKQLYPPGTFIIPAHLQHNVLSSGSKRIIKEYVIRIDESDFYYQGDDIYVRKTSMNKGGWNNCIYESMSKTLSAIITDMSNLDAIISSENTRIPSLSDLTSIVEESKIPTNLGDIEFLRSYPDILDKLVERSDSKSLEPLISLRTSGFTWSLTSEGSTFWSTVLMNRNPEYYYTKYPKPSSTVNKISTMNDTLPKKWYLKITANNIELVNRYRDFKGYNRISLSHVYKNLKYSGLGYEEHELDKDIQFISDSDFIIFLKKQGIDTTVNTVAIKEPEKPKSINRSLDQQKWCVKITNSNKDLCNEFRKNTIYTGVICQIDINNNTHMTYTGYRSSIGALEDYRLLSESEFQSMMAEKGIHPINISVNPGIKIPNEEVNSFNPIHYPEMGYTKKQLETVQVGMIPVK